MSDITRGRVRQTAPVRAMPTPCRIKSQLVEDLIAGKAKPANEYKDPMLYTDAENQTWFKSLSRLEVNELFDRMLEAEGCGAGFVQTVKSIRRVWGDGVGHLTPKQIALLRKWA